MTWANRAAFGAVLFGALVLGAFGAAQAAKDPECRAVRFDEVPFTLCEIDMRAAEVRLFLRDADGQPFATFGRVDGALRDRGERLVLGMNAGMYHEDRSPVGHYVEYGVEEMGVVSSDGPGNFGLLPNGILCLREDRADVIETTRFLARRPDCTHATQSGPMLVIEGALHPRFLPASDSLYVRNGVGTSADGTTLIWAISEMPVNFHHFARLFRDGLGLPNALYLDGNVSRLFVAATGRSDFGRPMGPILGVVAPATPPKG